MKHNGLFAIRYFTIRSKDIKIPIKGKSVILTEQSILDMKDMLEAGVEGKDIVGVLKDAVERASLDIT